MTTSAAELAELRGAVRRALGVETGAIPEIDRQWRAGWPALAEIGLLGFCAPEGAGGFGNEVPAALVVSRELGGALHGSPYAASVGAAYVLARSRDPDPATGALIESVLWGEQVVVLGFLDP